MDHLLHDLRTGARMLLRSPGFTALAILTLALGIGADTALFTVVNAVLLHPIPYTQPDRLVVLWSAFPGQGLTRSESALPDYRAWRDDGKSFDGLGAFYYGSFNLSREGGDAERVQGALVTANFLSVLGVTPALGRSFSAEEEQPGRDRVVVLSHGLWKRRYGADPKILGRTIAISGLPHQVVGVLPEGFPFLDDNPPVEILSPISFPPGDIMDSRNNRFVSVIGRLAPGATVEGAQAEVSTIAKRLGEEYTQCQGMEAQLAPLGDALVQDSRKQLWVLFGAVFAVLLIACANVANLLLARAASREREIAIRASLGAGRARLLRQILLEGVPLAALGGLGGLLLAVWGTEGLVKLLPLALPRYNPIGFDRSVFLFATTLSLFTVLLFGLAPAWHVSRPDLRGGLGEGGRGSTAGRRRHTLLAALVSSEMALSLVLLTGAGLMLRSFNRLRSADAGFSPASTLTLSIPAGRDHSGRVKARQLFEEIVARASALPGVRAAGVSTVLPMGFGIGWGKYFSIEGRPAPERVDQVPIVKFALVSDGYFSAAGITVGRGRGFRAADTEESQQVAVVNDALVRRFFPGEDPLGRIVYLGTPESLQAPGGDLARYVRRTIVGVVADVKDSGLREAARPGVYVPYTQSRGEGWSDTMALAVRSTGNARALAPALTAIVRDIDPEQPVTSVATLEDLVDRALSRSRFGTLLLGLFATLAVLLAAVGIYGVSSYAVTQRTSEFGIRMALGARGHDIVRLVLGRGALLAGVGVAAGLAVAVVLTRLLSAELYEISATDPVTFAAVSLILTAVAVLACYVPARRATRVDPAVALRSE